MLPNRQRLKLLFVLGLAQVACLAAGLWIHHRFVASAVHAAAEARAVAELEREAGRLVEAAAGRPAAADAEEADRLADVRAVLRSARVSPGIGWLAVDSQWRVLGVLHSGQDEAPAGPAQARTLRWRRLSRGADHRVRGCFTMPDGLHLAVGRRVGGPEGWYLIAQRRMEGVEMAPAVFLRSQAAVGVITWLWMSALLLTAVYMIVTRLFDELAKRRAQAEAETLRRIQSLVRTRDAVIFGLARLAESRDPTTGRHLERISVYASRLAAALRHHPKYHRVVTPEFVQLIGISSALHDIGKVAIEDAIVRKPGKLTEAERERMKEHTTIGAKHLSEIEGRLGSSNFLQMSTQIARSHHERWDGGGYPQGLAGEQIPLAARIVAVADVYDALSTSRPYKAALPHAARVEEIRRESARHFDPQLVEIFLQLEPLFFEIASQYADNRRTAPGPAGGEPAAGGDRQATGLVSVGAAFEQPWAVPATFADPG